MPVACERALRGPPAPIPRLEVWRAECSRYISKGEAAATPWSPIDVATPASPLDALCGQNRDPYEPIPRIGQDTITTVPPGTMDAFRDHGRVQVTLGTEEEAADAALESAAALGLDVHAMTEQLQADALKAFASSFDQLLATLAEKRRRNLTAAS